MAKTILAVGAHYDDCIFGISGTLLKAVEQGHRVVMLTLIGDYTNWGPVGSRRQTELLEGTKAICREFGTEMRFLEYASMGIAEDAAARAAVSGVVAEVRPDIGFLLWPRDSHPDHEVASQLTKLAFQFAGTVLRQADVRRPDRLYFYDNGPRHTFGFEPDTFVDVSRTWSRAIGWLGKLMALVSGESDPSRFAGALKSKEALSAFRGKACGVEYAEAFRSFQSYPVDVF